MGHTWGAVAAIAGGALWAVVATLRTATEDAPLFGLSWLSGVAFGRLSPLARVLLLVALPALHRAHRGRTGALGRWGASLGVAGLVLDLLGRVLEYWVHGGLVDDASPGATIGRLISLLGVALLTVGLLLFGAAVQGARVLEGWARPALLLVGVVQLSTFVVIFFPEVAQQVLGATYSWLIGAGWVAAGLGLLALRPAADEGAGEEIERAGGAAGVSVWRSFVSPGTLVSALIAIGVWSLEWSWAVGALVVVLLYAHEAGHVLAALTRGVRVERAPFFLPGFGAFIQTGRTRSVWDEVWLSLGGPLLGSVVAIVAKLYGVAEELPALAHAGDFALLINAFNLVPFSPLDGGRTVARTGWLGFLLTLALGAGMLFLAFDLFIALLVLSGVVQAYRAARERVSYGWGTRLAVLAIYLVVVTLVVGMMAGTGRVDWLPSSRPTWMPSLWEVFQVVFWTYLAGTLALPYAWRPEQSALVRYVIAAALGWPQYLLGRPWMIPVTFLLAAQTLGLPGARWLGALVRRWAVGGNPAAGAAASYGFDCLRRQYGMPDGSPDPAAEWLEGVTPALVAGGPEVLGVAFRGLEVLGYLDSAVDWFGRLEEGGGLMDVLSPTAANNYAWGLLLRGQAERALPYARLAVASLAAVEPGARSSFTHTLGRVLLELSSAVEAEAALRESLAAEDRPRTWIALARAVARQGRVAEAIELADRVLKSHVNPWPDDEGTRQDVEGWVEAWRAEVNAPEAKADRASSGSVGE